MSAPPPDLEGLFAAEKAGDIEDVDAAGRDRVRYRLESSVASLAGASGHLASPLPPASFAHGPRAKIIGAVVAGALAGGALGHVTGYQAGVRAKEATKIPVEVIAPVAPALSTVVPPPPVTPPPEPSSSTIPVLSAHASSTPAPPSRDAIDRDGLLAEETSLLRTARTALLRGDAAGALAVTETHRARFPGGRLVEERESIAIQSLVRLERADEARGRAAAFERMFPNSVALPVIRAAVVPR